MNVLWITNIIITELAEQVGQVKAISGGWLEGYSHGLKTHDEIHLCIVSVWKNKRFYETEINGVRYFLLPQHAFQKRNTLKNNTFLYWEHIRKIFSPDIVHIHGTEFNYGYSYLLSYPEDKIVASIQGLISVIPRYYLASMNRKDVFLNLTLRNLIKQDNVFQVKKKFEKRGEVETEYINRLKYIIGRTTWDNVHIKLSNPNIRYFFCNEILRDCFYNGEWNINSIKRYSIFISQANYPLKGFHQILKALRIVKNVYPDVKLYVAGKNITSNDTLFDKLIRTDYGKYIKKFILRAKLNNNIVFLGNLDANQMRDQYLNSHLFVCPSSIENSPNSLGEAQLLGVPCIGSYVGGIPDMIEDKITGFLYRFEEYEMLANLICYLFSDDKKCIQISQNAKTIARMRHNRDINTKTLISIYNEINSNL